MRLLKILCGWCVDQHDSSPVLLRTHSFVVAGEYNSIPFFAQTPRTTPTITPPILAITARPGDGGDGHLSTEP